MRAELMAPAFAVVTHPLAFDNLDLVRLCRARPDQWDGAAVEGGEVALEAEKCLCSG